MKMNISTYVLSYICIEGIRILMRQEKNLSYQNSTVFIKKLIKLKCYGFGLEIFKKKCYKNFP